MAEMRKDQGGFAELSADLLRRGMAVRFRAHGRSMEPLIRDGDVLTVEPARLADLRVGDIALHRVGGGQLVAHRVVARRTAGGQTSLATRGDAAFGAADAVGEQDVLGRVVARERDGRVVRLGRGMRRLGGRLWVTVLACRGLARRLAGGGRRLAARLRRRA